MKIMIGAAQFGNNYETSDYQKNMAGVAHEIMEIAINSGIDWVDTAYEYGSSEGILGSMSKKLNIVTKVFSRDPDTAVNMFKESLDRLNVKSVDGLLVHSVDDKCGEELFDALYKLKDAGLTKNIGISVYDPEDALAFSDKYPLDIIQIPVNIVDQRFVETGTMHKIAKRGIKIHIRSVFLKGLLFANPEDIADHCAPLIPSLLLLKQLARDNNISVLDLLIGYVKSLIYVDKIIIGAHSVTQLKKVVESYNNRLKCDIDFKQLAMNDESAIDPRNWSPQGTWKRW